jgi:putative spermidine/putrescine transport system ATP-binding protein
MARIRLEEIEVTFGTVHAVKGLNLEVQEGEFLTLLGPSGCGKTTTLRLIAGFVKPSRGRVFFHDQDVTEVPPFRRNIGIVYQNYALFPHMTVFENVAFGLRIRRWNGRAIEAKVVEVLDLVKMGAWRDRYPRELSGGMQQRVAVARALAIEPDILLFDEPLSALDAKLRVELREEIRTLHRRVGKVAMVYVTHDQEEALVVSDRIVVMNAGRIEQVGAPSEIYHRPRTVFAADFMGAANFLQAKVVETRPGREDLLVLLGNHPVILPCPENAGAEDTVLFCIRPENIRIGGSAANRLSGYVSDLSFKGSMIRVRVMVNGLSETQALTVEVPASPAPSVQIGQDVVLTFEPTDCVVLSPEIPGEGLLP